MIKKSIKNTLQLLKKSQKPYTEEELIKRAQNGDDDSFEELINKNEKYLYKMAYLYVKNEHDAMDIFQETILSAFINIEKLQNPNYFKTWITKILINKVHTKNRYDNKFNNGGVEDYIGEVAYSNIESKLDIRDAIDSLENKYKTPIILQYFYDLTIPQIADIMESNENTIKTNIRRGKKRMYDILKEDYNG